MLVDDGNRSSDVNTHIIKTSINRYRSVRLRALHVIWFVRVGSVNRTRAVVISRVEETRSENQKNWLPTVRRAKLIARVSAEIFMINRTSATVSNDRSRCPRSRQKKISAIVVDDAFILILLLYFAAIRSKQSIPAQTPRHIIRWSSIRVRSSEQVY